MSNVLNPLQKLSTILSILPQINGIVINSLGQINQIIPGGVLPDASKLAVVEKTLTDTLTLAGDIGVEVQGLVNLGMSFATGLQGLITQFHTSAPPTP